MFFAEGKKPVTKKNVVYDSTSMKCPEQTNSHRQKVDVWLPKAGGWVEQEDGGDWGFLSGWWKCSKLIAVMFAQLYEYAKNF